jgi:hypothetical protein
MFLVAFVEFEEKNHKIAISLKMQGDQIGRIFDHWVAIFFGQFLIQN